MTNLLTKIKQWLTPDRLVRLVVFPDEYQALVKENIRLRTELINLRKKDFLQFSPSGEFCEPRVVAVRMIELPFRLCVMTRDTEIGHHVILRDDTDRVCYRSSHDLRKMPREAVRAGLEQLVEAFLDVTHSRKGELKGEGAS